MRVMELTVIRTRQGMTPTAGLTPPDTGYVLQVAVVYQDTATRQWAEQVCGRMAQVAGLEAIHRTEWKVGDLNASRVFSEGAAALAQADLIVVALYAAERLPAAFYLWVNVWLQQRAGHPGALVALLVPPEASVVEARETRRYLSAVAGQGHLDFLVQECRQPGTLSPELDEDLLRWTQAA